MKRVFFVAATVALLAAASSASAASGGECSPASNAARVLKSPNPNDVSPQWSGDAYIGTSWTLEVQGTTKNDTGIYLFGRLISPRGRVQKGLVYVVSSEWDCDK